MRTRALAVLAVAGALAACATQPAAPVAPSQAEWDAIPAADFTCKPGEYADADFQAVLAAPERYYETCIRLHALLDKDILVRDAASLPASAERRYDRMIGVFFKDAAPDPRLGGHPQFVIASGRLRACGERTRRLQALAEREHAAFAPKPGEPYKGPIRVVTPDGFCRYSAGPALYVTDIAALPTAMD